MSHSTIKIGFVLLIFNRNPTMSRIAITTKKPPKIINPYVRNKNGMLRRLKSRISVHPSLEDPSRPMSLKRRRLR